MSVIKVTDSIFCATVDDVEIDLFEGQYPVQNGVTYNSYVVKGKKIAILDTVDATAGTTWFEYLDEILGSDIPDFLVVSHMEPDHSSNIALAMEKYPNMKIVGNKKTFTMIEQFFGESYEDRRVVVEDGEKLNLEDRELTFYTAPMVHWPEVMVVYDSKEKILFTADAFGKFGSSETNEPWDDEARRYYYNIVGKYGPKVLNLFEKISDLEIKVICPLHGPVLDSDLSHYLGLYKTWANYEPETKGVFIAYASIHGNTGEAAVELASILEEKGVEATICDLNRVHHSYALAEAFRYDRMVLACSTYDGGILPAMDLFLIRLKAKNYCNRKVGVIENGTWGPVAGKHIKDALGSLDNIEIVDPTVTIKSSVKEETIEKLKVLAESLN